jgi:hypothetical protein
VFFSGIICKYTWQDTHSRVWWSSVVCACIGIIAVNQGKKKKDHLSQPKIRTVGSRMPLVRLLCTEGPKDMAHKVLL